MVDYLHPNVVNEIKRFMLNKLNINILQIEQTQRELENQLKIYEQEHNNLKEKYQSSIQSTQTQNHSNLTSQSQGIEDEKKQYRIQSIMRYKQKRRKWCKQIQYHSRQHVAVRRPRIQGRFISKKIQNSLAILMNIEHEKLIPEVFDEKKNLDIEKFSQRMRVFARRELKISKKQILQKIHSHAQIYQNLEQRISAKNPIFKLITVEK